MTQETLRASAGSPDAPRTVPGDGSFARNVIVPWGIGIAALVAMRYRGSWDAYVALHRWMAELGVPDALRHYDSLVWTAVAVVCGAAMTTRRRADGLAILLGFRAARPGWSRTVALSCAPMVVGGCVVGWLRATGSPDAAGLLAALSSGVVRAALGEELLFRGLLVAVPAASIGWHGRGWWLNAALAALCFGMVHIAWTRAGLQGWPTVLVTAAGGLWYAWLLARWQTLWVPIALHAGMNLGWLAMGATGGAAGGGLIDNALRVATIAAATVITVRSAPATTTAPTDR